VELCRLHESTMRCSALTWMMGSAAARRFVTRRMEAVTRRTSPEMQTPEPVRVVVAAVPLSTWMRRASKSGYGTQRQIAE
jgi:hypothetical protein